MGKAEQESTAGSMQMKSVAPMAEPAADEPPHASAAALPQQAAFDGGEAVARAERLPVSSVDRTRGYPYTVSIEPAPAGSAVGWRLHITSAAGTTRNDVASARSNQEARVEKLMDG
jgi:hypothetical protein|eukprot:COSAG02_NODE_2695_length_8214_cov_12.071842_4_plen_116_part_00